MTIAEAAEFFNVSKEAIHNRIRRKSLNSIVENGTKLVVVSEAKGETQGSGGFDTKYTAYIEQENERLRGKVEVLEQETFRLRDQREKMLIDEREKIEQIYKERDAQLRNVLNVVATKFLAHSDPGAVVEEAMTVDAINVDLDENTDEWISLKAFLKLKRLNDKEKKDMKRRFKAIAKWGDKRLSVRDDKVYLCPTMYDYSDLLY